MKKQKKEHPVTWEQLRSLTFMLVFLFIVYLALVGLWVTLFEQKSILCDSDNYCGKRYSLEKYRLYTREEMMENAKLYNNYVQSLPTFKKINP